MHAASVAEKFAEPEAHIETRDEKAYRRMLEDYLAPATMLLALLIGIAIFRLPYQAAEDLADNHLSINEDEAALIIPPLARILDKQHFNTRVKTAIQSSGDYIGLVMGVGSYLLRTVAVLQEVSVYIHGQPSQQAAQQAVQPAAASNGHQPAATANLGFINAGGLIGG